MEPLEEAAYGMRLPSVQDCIRDGREYAAADVGVAEATEQVVASEQRARLRTGERRRGKPD